MSQGVEREKEREQEFDSPERVTDFFLSPPPWPLPPDPVTILIRVRERGK
jgi:hypothetical protein